MTPPIFATVNVPAVQALLKTGNGPLRFYAWGQAPQGVAYPYAVWRFAAGIPENYLGDRPDIDSQTLQVDVYAADTDAQGASKVRQIAVAMRHELETVSHITSWGREDRDPDTRAYTFTFDVDFWTPRT